MPGDKSHIETRMITAEEAEACASEQVQFIGKIQPHGFLLVAEISTLKIIQYSANFLTLLNSALTQPLAESTKVLDSQLLDWIKYDPDIDIISLSSTATHNLTFSQQGLISSDHWECSVTSYDTYILFEFFPISEKLSTYNLLGNLDKMVAKIRAIESLDELLQGVTDEFQKHTRYDRVMIYKFKADWSGEVVAESVSERTQVEFLGHHFPAEDIPRKARELYMSSSLRVIVDVDAEPVELIPPKLPSGVPLDLSNSILRAMSPMHVQYLKNMGIKSSLSIALITYDKLWGLMSFHNYTPRVPPNHLVSDMRASCELFTDIVVSNLVHALELEKLHKCVTANNTIDIAFRHVNISSENYFILHKVLASIMQGLPYDHIGIIINNKTFVTSANEEWKPDEHFATQLTQLISQSDEDFFFQSSKLLQAESKTVLSDQINIAGIMLLKSMSLPGLMVFFAYNEIEKHVDWGGKPGTVNIVIKNNERHLEPRSSFALWRQKVSGCSKDWTDEDREILNTLLVNTQERILISQSEEIKQKLHEASYKDSLTGLPNRRHLEEFVEKLSKNPGDTKKVTVLFLDLDNFKKINDYIGHDAGDRLLIETAKRIMQCVRQDDVVVRLGGDEFMVILRHISADDESNKAISQKISEKILHSVSTPVFDAQNPLITTPSIGAIMCDPENADFNEMFKRADIAMYHAKNTGKNKVHFFSDIDQEKVNFEGDMEIELRKYVADADITLYFQPQVNVDMRIVSAEALVRWNHPTLGFISPDVFIPIAEKNHFIHELGLLIFDQACRQFSLWRTQKRLGAFETLSVNVSPLQLMRDDFSDEIIKIVKKYRLHNSQIRLEITESIFMENFENAVVILTKLRSKGFTVSLDDFGTGYSSLSYLLRLPIDEVKIDKSFIASLTDSSDSFKMVEGIINLCQNMSMPVVAEGVETKVQYHLLKGIGCKRFQGYYFSKPVPAEAFQFTVNHNE